MSETCLELVHLFPRSVTNFVKGTCRAMGDTCVSNVCGPQSALTLMGSKVDSAYNVTSPLSYDLTFNILSYNGYITVASVIDKNSIANPEALYADINNSVQELVQAYGQSKYK